MVYVFKLPFEREKQKLKCMHMHMRWFLSGLQMRQMLQKFVNMFWLTSPNHFNWERHVTFSLFMLFPTLSKNSRLICNAHLEILRKNHILQFYENIFRWVLQIDLLFLDKVGKSMNNLNLKSQVIWSGESKIFTNFCSMCLIFRPFKNSLICACI